jgi:hypothetical protein
VRSRRPRPRNRHARNPYRLLVTDDPTLTLGECEVASYHSTMLGAANAFVKSGSPYKQIVWDDGHHARELDSREQQLLEHVCDKLGHDLGEVGS